MKKKMITAMIAVVLTVASLPFVSFADVVSLAEPISAYVTIVNKGEIVLAQKEITVADRDNSGDFDLDETLYAAHESAYAGGAAAGYNSYMGSYGIAIGKLWGDQSGNYGYWNNNNSCYSLFDKVCSGDYVVAFVYKDTTVWDPYTRFGSFEYAVLEKTPLTVTLEKAGYDSNWNTVFAPYSAANVKVFDGSMNELAPDDVSVANKGDGTYEITFDSVGDYIIAAFDDSVPIVPSVARVTVGQNPDQISAKTVKVLIDAIGNVTLDSEEQIIKARAQYNALTETQKAMVDNLDELINAEQALEKLKEDEKLSGYMQVDKNSDPQKVYDNAANYLKSLGSATVGGEGMVLALTRGGNDIPENYLESTFKFIRENIDQNGRLHNLKSSENSRIIVGLTSAGVDATNVDGYNLLKGLSSMNYIRKQGINGIIWGLIAVDSYGYEIPNNEDPDDKTTREKMIESILLEQLDDGGWSLFGEFGDIDITAMTVQALAPYYEKNEDVTSAVDKALELLSYKQFENGGFGTNNTVGCESTAQVVVALSALNIDAEKDQRFIKSGKSAVDALCAMALENGAFEHIKGEGINGMATEQGAYALAAYLRMKEGKTALFDMTDLKLKTKNDSTVSEITKENPVTTDTSKVGTAFVLMIMSTVIFAIIFKKQRIF